MYTTTNFRTKKAFKEAFAKGERITVFQPGPFEGTRNGTCSIEGPHFPAPHTWYARVAVTDGVITKILG